MYFLHLFFFLRQSRIPREESVVSNKIVQKESE